MFELLKNTIIQDYLVFDVAFEYIHWESLIFVLEAFVLLYLGKLLHGFFSPYKANEQLVKLDNKAFSVSFSGYIMGIGLIIFSVIKEGETFSLYFDLFEVAFWSFVGILLLNLSRFINDRLILYKFDNVKEILKDKNIGTGAVQFGSYFGSAIVLSALISQPASDPFLIDVFNTIIYFFITQLFFVLFGFIYQKITVYDFHEEIERDNAAAGVSFGLTLVAIGIVIAHPLKSSYGIVSFFIWFVNGVVLLALSRFLIDKVMIRGVSLEDEIKNDQNWGVALLEGGIAITVAFILQASFT